MSAARARTLSTRLCVVAALAATAVGGTAATSSAADDPNPGHRVAAPHSTTGEEPTKAAEVADIDEGGDAYMGWHQHRSATPVRRDVAPAAPLQTAAESVPGIDVSGHQGNVDWASMAAAGHKFAYVKATEGTGYTNEYFAQQYNGSYDAGLIRGAYHFALPNESDGATQANYFVDHGGGWSADGKTLPGALDIEYNPYGDTCYGMSADELTQWIADFSNTYKERTGVYPTIYTAYNWWEPCTGNSAAFNQTNPLWIASYADTPGVLPGGWGFHTFWQYTDSPVDTNSFNGSYDRLVALASGS